MHIVTNIRHITRQHVTRSQLHTVNDGANVQFHWTHFVFECMGVFFSPLYFLSITFIHSLIFLPFVCIYPCWLCVCVFFFVLFSFCVHYFQFPHPFAQCFHCVCTEMSFTISCIFLPFGCVLFYSLFFYFSLIFYVDYDFNWILSFFSSRIVLLISNKYFSWLFHFVIGFLFDIIWILCLLCIFPFDIYQKKFGSCYWMILVNRNEAI